LGESPATEKKKHGEDYAKSYLAQGWDG